MVRVGKLNLMSVRVRAHAAVDPKIVSWHSTHRPPVGWRVAFVLRIPGESWGDLTGFRDVGVSTWGRPVARGEDQVHTMEHTRMALGPGAPKNSASWFLAANRAWIRRYLPEVRKLIAYVDEDQGHTGVTYRADGWEVVYRARVRSQTWSSRPGRTGRQATSRTKFCRAP